MKDVHARPFLELRDLRKRYGRVDAVDGVSLSVSPGEFVALLGPSGCGKTTTLRMIAGFVTPSAGEIRLRGNDVTYLQPQRRNMGMVFQNYALFPHMTVEANVEFGLVSHRVPASLRTARIREVLELVGLSGEAGRYPRQLSGGQQQRVALARVLALQPDLLLFDEPLSNLDAKLRVQMRHEIRRLQRELGITALFVTHDQEEAMTIADRIAVMNRGRIEQVGTPREIYDSPASRFVADFIGLSNILEGVVARAGAEQVLRCGNGLDVPIAGDHAVGAPLALVIRPEKLALGPQVPGAVLKGTIREAVLLGALNEYLVELQGGTRLVVQEQRGPGLEDRPVGAPVSVVWDRHDAVILGR